MQSKNWPPKARHKRWHQWLVDQGCLACGRPASLHHCVGAAGHHRKTWIGQDFVLPLCYDHHQGTAAGIHHNLAEFQRQALGRDFGLSRSQLETALFGRVVAVYRRQHAGALPCPADVLAVIEQYNKGA